MRFHMGVSFSWRTIKKFLFPVLIGLLAYFGFNFIFDNSVPLGFLQVKAYTNTDTTYNIDFPDYKTQLEQKTCGNTNASELIDYIIKQVDWGSSQYQMWVAPPYYLGSSYVLTMYFKTTSSVDTSMWVRGQGSGSTFFNLSPSQWTFNGGRFDFLFNNCDSNLDVKNSSIIISLLDFIQNGTTFNTTNNSIGSWINGTQNNVSLSYNVGSSFNNNSSYNIPFWYFFSSFKWQFSTPTTSSTHFYKKLYFVQQNEYFEFDDYLPDYYSYYYGDITFVDYKESLDTFYTSFIPTYIANYNLKIKFNTLDSLLGYSQSPTEYYNNVRFNYVCNARSYNNNYYSYIKIPCSLSSSAVVGNNSIEYTFSNFTTTSTNIAFYDKIFVTIIPTYLDNSINRTIKNLKAIFSIGEVYNSLYMGSIYETFLNLPIGFKLYVSSNNPSVTSYLYYKKSSLVDYGIKVRGFSNTSFTQNLIVDSSIIANYNSSTEVWGTINDNIIRINVTSQLDNGALIWQENGYILSNLHLSFDSGFILSFQNNISSNDFYYIDNEGNIQNTTINNDFYSPRDDNVLDISYYVEQINVFINDLSKDTLKIHVLTQDFYNSLPSVFKDFIFATFILLMIILFYKVIKR